MSQREKIGIDMAKLGEDNAVTLVRAGTRTVLLASANSAPLIDREWINGLNAGRKAEREQLAMAFETIAAAHGATVVRKVEGRHAGWHSGSIDLRIALNGVGAMLDISNLHGGDRGLIHWYGEGRAAQNFTSRFALAVGDLSTARSGRPHHKATSHGSNWLALAMQINNGLLIAARGEAFAQPSAS